LAHTFDEENSEQSLEIPAVEDANILRGIFKDQLYIVTQLDYGLLDEVLDVRVTLDTGASSRCNCK
jgi:hypothetical protein